MIWLELLWKIRLSEKPSIITVYLFLSVSCGLGCLIHFPRPKSVVHNWIQLNVPHICISQQMYLFVNAADTKMDYRRCVHPSVSFALCSSPALPNLTLMRAVMENASLSGSNLILHSCLDLLRLDTAVVIRWWLLMGGMVAVIISPSWFAAGCSGKWQDFIFGAALYVCPQSFIFTMKKMTTCTWTVCSSSNETTDNHHQLFRSHLHSVFQWLLAHCCGFFSHNFTVLVNSHGSHHLCFQL